MVYQWKEAARIKVDANVAGKVCEDLANTVGLTAQTLLDASMEESAPLHNEFEWDDKKAAEAHRENQARYIIRMLCVKNESVKEITPVRAFFQSTTEKFENIEVIINKEEKRSALLNIALKELTAFKNKYRMLSELKPVFEVVDYIIESNK